MKFVNNFVFGVLSLLFPIVTHAYIGPGAGLSAIGTAIALLAALIFLIVGFVWYPVKRLLRRRKTDNAQSEAEKSQSEED